LPKAGGAYPNPDPDPNANPDPNSYADPDPNSDPDPNRTKAGGVALNLTVASRIFLMDPWWNPAAEYQAIDRAHRLGQHKPIRAVRLVTRHYLLRLNTYDARLPTTLLTTHA
jgi:hypothetical protein